MKTKENTFHLSLNRPRSLFIYWSILFLAFCLTIPFLGIGYSGGDQRELTLLANGLEIFFDGLALLSLVSAMLFWSDFKKRIYIHAVIIILVSIKIVCVDILEIPEDYDSTLDTKTIGKYELKTQRQYYSNTKLIRSEKFYINNEKDSVWTTFDRKGNLLKKEVYKNGMLIK